MLLNFLQIDDTNDIQMSTPVKKKKRRISNPSVKRLSCIAPARPDTFFEEDYVVSVSHEVCVIQQGSL